MKRLPETFGHTGKQQRIFAVVNALGKPEVRFGIQTVLVSEEPTFLLFEIFSPLRASHLAGQFLSSPSTIAGHLPSNLEPATAKFKSLHVADKFLSSLSVTVEKTNGMMKLHDAVGAHLKRQNIETRSGRFPHMSLFYLDEATPGECYLLTERLRKRGLVTKTRDGILLHSAIDDSEKINRYWSYGKEFQQFNNTSGRFEHFPFPYALIRR
ncbi:hypothetical protein B0H14DRAFT_2594129 [Mycena olivaceomarginata]|nr:hypothetical protein B0H14DRAFT_2594129 [Mycena olivaceomarginata]